VAEEKILHGICFGPSQNEGMKFLPSLSADSSGHYPLKLPAKIRPLPLAGYWSRKLGQEALSKVAGRIPRGTRLRAYWDRLQEAVCWRTVQWHDRRFARRIEVEFFSRWNEFDAVYVHGNAELAERVARYRPTVLRLPGPVSSELAPLLKSVHVVCANGDALTQIREFLGEHATELPIGIDSDMFRPDLTSMRERLGWTEENWVVGYVGRLAYVKGVDLLADAFRKVRKTIPHARMLIVGAGEEEGKLRATLNTELMEGIVHMESDVAHELLADWYRAMDLFVMPSRYENYSNSVIEALACGVPCLLSDVGGNRRLVEMEAGWLFTKGSADSLASTLSTVAKRLHSTGKLKTFVGEKVRQCYRWEISADRLEYLLQSCVEGRQTVGLAQSSDCSRGTDTQGITTGRIESV
jgi:glycosyltransferase involved in cell wall biosynthesis